VLDHLSITIRRVQYVALAGPSGCAKSTVLGLIERFYDVDHGQIRMRGIDVDDIRRQLSLVAQEPILYQGPIKENILLGCDHSVDDGQLDKITKQAQIHDLILSLPEGYRTQVGAGGTALSGDKSRE